jgi:hypothetical protein
LLDVIVIVWSVKFGVVAGVAQAFFAVTVALNACPAVSGAAGMPLKAKLAGAAMNMPLPGAIIIVASVGAVPFAVKVSFPASA